MHQNRILLGILLLSMASGCSVNTKFVYKPSAPAASGPKLPMKIAVLPFTDGTENFTVLGSALIVSPVMKFNLAKEGIAGRIGALPPELWSKAFADELSASGRFESVRFLYDRSELADETFLVEGTLKKADLNYGTLGDPHEIALALRAAGRAEERAVWERDVSKAWKFPAGQHGCGVFDEQCVADKLHASFNGAMREMFAEAGADLARALAPLAGGGTGEGANPTAAPPAGPAPSSVDETIENILKGK